MRYLGLILGLVMFAGVVNAQTADDVAKIESYLNSVKSMEARFIQTASNGNSTQGKLYIQKPNKLHMVYDAPVDVLIVGDGQHIIYNDKELDQVTHIDYDDIPAAIILGNQIKIDGKNLKITKFYKDAGTTVATVEQSKNGDIGPIKLVFSNDPLELKQWSIVDPQSVEITVSLYDIENNKNLDSGLFKFRKSKGAPGYRGK